MSENRSFPNEVSPNPEVLTRRMHDEMVLFHRRTELSCVLDPVATSIWVTLLETRSVEAAFDKILAVYEVEESRLRRDFRQLLEDLLENGWILEDRS